MLLPVDRTAPNALVVLVIFPNRPLVVAIEVEEPGDELATTSVDFGVVKVVNEELTNGEEVLLEAEVILGKKADDAEPAVKLNALLPAEVTEGAAVMALLAPPREKPNSPPDAGVADVAAVVVIVEAPKALPVSSDVLPILVKDGELDFILPERA